MRKYLLLCLIWALGLGLNATFAQVLVPSTGSNTVACGTNVTLCDHAGCSANYSNSVNGFTVLQNAGGAVISITGSFATESCCDYIRIYAGTGTAGVMLQEYRGTGTANFTSQPGQTITVQFFSDGSVVAAGFNFNVTYTGSCELTIPASGSSSLPCGATGLTLLDNGGASGNYANNSNGFITLNSGFVAVINLNGTYNTEAGADSIIIYNGAGIAGTVLASYTGSGNINFTANPGQTITVRFVSNGSVTNTGFALAITTTGACTNQRVVPLTGLDSVSCGTPTITLCDHAGCSANYGNNANGSFVFNNSANAVITITGSFAVESCCDRINIRNGIGPTAPLITQIGSTGTGTINFTSQPGQTITIQFTSDGSVVNTGFNLTVSYTGSCQLCPTPTIVASATPATVCVGDTARLNATAQGAGPYTYNWAPATGLSATNVANPLASNVTATQAYAVTMTDPQGCTQTATTTVSVFSVATASVTALGSTVFCQGNQVNFESSAATAYLWSSGETTRTVSVNSSTPYTLTTTDANGCTATANAPGVTVNPLPNPVITPLGATAICYGDSTQLDAGSGFVSYFWNNSQTTQVATIRDNGGYVVTVVDANGCVNSSTLQAVQVNFTPLPSLTANGPFNFCAGAPALTISSTPFSTYLWSTGETTQSITVNTPGSYAVTVTDSIGCVGFSAVQPVNIFSAFAPNLSISGCNPVVVNASNFSAYVWSTGATTQSINVSTAGTYSITATDVNGCTATASIPYTPAPALSIAVDSIVDETAALNGGIFLNITGGTAPYYVQWSNGQTGTSLSGLQAATYQVTVTDANGCSSTGSYTVNYSVPVLTGTDLAAQAQIKLYPNPTQGAVWLSWELPQAGELNCRVFDATGRLLGQQTWDAASNGLQGLSLEAYPSGLYWIHLSLNGQLIHAAPVSKQ